MPLITEVAVTPSLVHFIKLELLPKISFLLKIVYLILKTATVVPAEDCKVFLVAP